MQLTGAFAQLAQTYDLNEADLIRYAGEDTIGGYHSDAAQSRWHVGSIWGVEGQLLYALVRAIKPKMVVELGSFKGCSSHHIAQALLTNALEGKPGTLTCVDIAFQHSLPNGDSPLSAVIQHIQMEAVAYIENQMPSKKVDLIFEDLDHGVESVTAVWKTAQEKLKKGGFLVSHDAMHFVVGADVRFGILASGVLDAQLMLVEPSDCGFAVWRKP